MHARVQPQSGHQKIEIGDRYNLCLVCANHTEHAQKVIAMAMTFDCKSKEECGEDVLRKR